MSNFHSGRYPRSLFAVFQFVATAEVNVEMLFSLFQIPERTQSGKKHVISTGVLPSQLSTTVEAKSPMKNAWLHKRGENKVLTIVV